ncbi:MAG: hypothetical protein J6B48_03865 [Clostridia bacterium]|nr:hypothetical protein [Clostridia bacterium]
MEKFSEKWQALEAEANRRGGDGEVIVAAMKDHYKIYSESICLWLAGLYDKNIGGFYYSNSGRDNEPFRPDIESTNQATNFMLSSGLIDKPEDLPLAMREQMTKFCQSLISPTDGYIYHPQWDYNDPNWKQKDSRMGRDMGWAVDMARKFKFKYPYPTANERLKASLEKSAKNDDKSNLAPHLRSAEALWEYLETYNWETDAYFSGNNVVAQSGQIIAAGLKDVAVDFLNKKQNPQTGLWGVQGGYVGINALLKISGFYREAKAVMPNSDKAMQAAIDCITSDEDCGTICYQYNAWFSVSNILEILRNIGTPEAKAEAEKALKVLYKGAPEAIRATTEKVKAFAKPDGAFSYLQKTSTGFSQKAPVSIHMTVESDVNASVIASTGTTRHMYQALELLEFFVPFFDKEDRKKFLEALNY